MRKFNVNVNGTVYEVEVEEITSGADNSAGQTPIKKSVQTKKEKDPVATAPRTTSGIAGEKINSPMPGSIVSVNVKPGDSFAKEQVLLILEAMKMENEIMAPKSGTVVSVNVQKGSQVNAGDVLISYK